MEAAASIVLRSDCHILDLYHFDQLTPNFHQSPSLLFTVSHFLRSAQLAMVLHRLTLHCAIYILHLTTPGIHKHIYKHI